MIVFFCFLNVKGKKNCVLKIVLLEKKKIYFWIMYKKIYVFCSKLLF